MLDAETDLENSSTAPGEALRNPTSDPINFIFFKSERMYRHRIVRFNYTTYDVRRAQDVVNPGTTHCNIMLLKTSSNSSVDNSRSEEAPNSHPYLYARVIGIFHANIIYTGPGMINYTPTRLDFLWVRWYTYVPSVGSPHRLDQLRFPPMSEQDAFGFVDPADVLRSCHIIPAFHHGTRWEGNEKGISQCSRDSKVANTYYVGR